MRRQNHPKRALRRLSCPALFCFLSSLLLAAGCHRGGGPVRHSVPWKKPTGVCQEENGSTKGLICYTREEVKKILAKKAQYKVLKRQNEKLRSEKLGATLEGILYKGQAKRYRAKLEGCQDRLKDALGVQCPRCLSAPAIAVMVAVVGISGVVVGAVIGHQISRAFASP